MLGRKSINREIKVRAGSSSVRAGRLRKMLLGIVKRRLGIAQEWEKEARQSAGPLDIAKRSLSLGLALALAASLLVGIGVPSASAQTGSAPSVRIWVRKLASSNVEFGLSVTFSGTTRNVNLSNRYFLYESNEVGTWYNSEWQVVGSSRVGVTGPGSINTVARVRVRKLVSGNLEFGLGLRGLGAVGKDDRQVYVPRARYLLYRTAGVNVLRYSSDFDVSSRAEPCLNGTVFDNPQDKLKLADDCQTLLDSKDILAGTSDHLSSWTTSSALGSWAGIGRSGFISSGVNVLNLNSNQTGGRKLPGSIPSYLGDLSELVTLELSNNALTGSIPPELGDLSKLEDFFLDGNSLTGSIPSELGDLSELINLYLYGNSLTGSIPSELGNLNKLVHAYFDDNELDGSIPSELGNIEGTRNGAEGFTTLDLSDNNLSGSIPGSLGKLTELTGLYLYGNNLSGTIPSELGDLATNGLIDEFQLYEDDTPESDDNPGLSGCVPVSFNSGGRTGLRPEVVRGSLPWCSS